MVYKYDVRKGLTKIRTKMVVAVSSAAVASTALLVAVAMPLSAKAMVSNAYSLFGDASIVSDGNPGNAVQATTTGTNGYGGVDFGVPTGVTTVSSLNNLATDYKFTTGTCGLGSPRFSVEVTNGTTTGNLFFYIGPPPAYAACPPNVWTNSGNLAQPTNLVDATQVGGSFYEPYAAVQAAYGTYTIEDVALVADGPGQTVLFDNTQVDSNTYTYDQPVDKDSCKNGGWQSLTDINGNHFKNQGDCVSYVATGGRNQAAGH